MSNPYNTGLDQNAANHQPLTPLTFLERAAAVFPNYTESDILIPHLIDILFAIQTYFFDKPTH